MAERAYVRTIDLPDGILPLAGTEYAEVWQGDAETGHMVKIPYNQLQGNPVAHKASHELNGSDQLGNNNPAPNIHPISDSSGKLDTWISDASTTVKGKVQLATDGEAIAAKAVQANDERLSNARTPTAHGESHSSDGSDPIEGLPSIGQVQAMAGTYGTPSVNNKFVTDTDPRLGGQIITITSGTTLDIDDGSTNGEKKLIINTTSSWILLTTEQETGYILPYETIDLMWFVDCWYLLDGHKVGEILNVTFPLDKVPYGYLSLHSGLRPSRTAYSRLANTILYPLVDVPYTCTTATPSVFTKTAHGFVGGERLRLFNDEGGSLTGPTMSQDYFVERIDVNTFYLNTLEGGTAQLAITAQSGTHFYQCSAYGVGDGSTTFDCPDPRQCAFVGSGSGTTHNIASVDVYLNGQFKDDAVQGMDVNGSVHVASGTFNLDYGTDLATRAATTVSDGLTYDGVLNKALRKKAVTRGKRIGTNYIIKY